MLERRQHARGFRSRRDIAGEFVLESDDDVKANVRMLIENKGYSIVCPCPEMQQNPYTAGNLSQNISKSISSVGKTWLKRVYHSVFNNTYPNYGHLALDNSNSTKHALYAKTASYQTFFNQQQLQNQFVDCTKGEDWVYNYPTFAGKAIFNADHFKYFWTHCDDFQEGVDGDDVTVSGKFLQMNSYTWQFNGTMDANVVATNHVNIVVLNKILNISRAGCLFL